MLSFAISTAVSPAIAPRYEVIRKGFFFLLNGLLQATVVKGPETRVRCTLIPGDGVGPELVYSVQEVFKASGVPVDFETFFFSEVNPTLSAPLEDVAGSIERNRVCLKGILATPDYRSVAADSS